MVNGAVGLLLAAVLAAAIPAAQTHGVVGAAAAASHGRGWAAGLGDRLAGGARGEREQLVLSGPSQGRGALAGRPGGPGLLTARAAAPSATRELHAGRPAGLAGLLARAKAPTPEELHALKVRKIARSVDQVIGSTLSGYCGPWVIGMLIGSLGGMKGGFKAAMRNGVNTGNSWGLMSAAFCGLEVLSREVRGKHDKWNNMVGACGAGAVGACGRGLPAMATGCVNFAGMSYILDLLMERTQDPFDKAVNDPNLNQNVEGKVKTNKKK